MNRFIIASFLFMGVAYYEMSGGSDFIPETRSGDIAAAPQAQTAPVLPVREASIVPVVSTSSSATAAGMDTAGEARIVPASLGAAPAPAPAADRSPLSPEQMANITPVFTSLSESPDGSASVPIEDLNVARVDANRLNVRSGPSTGNGVVDQVSRGMEVAVVETVDGWSLIRIEGDGVEGWVADRFLVR
ncbi:SH3 domain-containing protein [Wenxinia saemankumensis]|uniref:SH3 domain-containing protein n=1 Tax=Wenxinia saemankumensis TaxID=1447782 RepID=A0A1M6C4S5_9RHOB|nr:SH3 domain-containing protein [Wenxinia saemankumensis]SHI56037.1 SH3 domain-containing protein [Wenxinia saemankumensis]